MKDVSIFYFQKASGFGQGVRDRNPAAGSFSKTAFIPVQAFSFAVSVSNIGVEVSIDIFCPDVPADHFTTSAGCMPIPSDLQSVHD